MHHTHLTTLIAFLALLGPLSAAQAREHATSAPAHGPARHGIAVWYGEDRNGQTMANGQVFDQWAMTGASTRFPLGTRVRVTDVQTQKRVTVTITDYTIPNSRVLIDLSHGAARTLGIETKGKARVLVVPVGFDRSQARQAHRS